MSKEIKKLRRTIMRRIYYAYALSIAAHPMLLHGVAFSIALAIFARQVHVASVINNFLSIEVSHVPSFLWHAIARGEVITLFAIGVIVFTALSVPWKVYHVPKRSSLAA